MNTVCVTNQKGGCGKTTTAVNLSWSLTELGKTILLVDLDPQGHASLALGFDTDLLDRTVRDSLIRPPFAVSELFLPFSDKLDVVPANISLASLEQELAGEPERELRLRQALADLGRPYDYVIVDCPPSLGFLTINALVAADEAIIPVETSSFSVHGLERLLETIEMVERNTGRRILVRVLATDFHVQTRYAREFLDALSERFGEQLFETVIHHSVVAKDAASRGLPVGRAHRHSKLDNDYVALATEIVESAPVVEVENLRKWEEKLFGPSVRGEEVVFRLHAPGARRVQLAGRFNDWDPQRGEMKQDPISGIWTIRLRVPKGSHQYRYIVDGEWIEDPANEVHEYGETGFRNSVVLVGDQ
ncbi:MAG: AAA family ATPase [Candidatus Eisenbacteria bacterium]|nr:AAA family ATPase [Candidatus Eisenbacteria bacterium]